MKISEKQFKLIMFFLDKYWNDSYTQLSLDTQGRHQLGGLISEIYRQQYEELREVTDEQR